MTLNCSGTDSCLVLQERTLRRDLQYKLQYNLFNTFYRVSISVIQSLAAAGESRPWINQNHRMVIEYRIFIMLTLNHLIP
jgi:hypothetical protein